MRDTYAQNMPKKYWGGKLVKINKQKRNLPLPNGKNTMGASKNIEMP